MNMLVSIAIPVLIAIPVILAARTWHKEVESVLRKIERW